MQMSEIQAIVLDLDGTLLDSSKSISPRNYDAVKQCFEAGIHVIVATARPPRVAKRFVKRSSICRVPYFLQWCLNNKRI
ncbi:HAD family hydrolase [Paenibacillus sp. GYB004]|uniref:HAD family hydrolase n=1 Tax=Paenibacillus sp. GYB004 TaxID=2994393 RepID=UPI003FA6C29E